MARGNTLTLYANWILGNDDFTQAYGILKEGKIIPFKPLATYQGRTSLRPQIAKPLSVRHDVYYDMLSMLQVLPKHWNNLPDRDLSAEAIRGLMYKTVPKVPKRIVLRRPWPIPNVVFHSLRHSSTTVKLKLNHGDIKSIQGDTGHATTDMITRVYSHIVDEDRKVNAQRFESAIYANPDLRAVNAPSAKASLQRPMSWQKSSSSIRKSY